MSLFREAEGVRLGTCTCGQPIHAGTVMTLEGQEAVVIGINRHTDDRQSDFLTLVALGDKIDLPAPHHRGDLLTWSAGGGKPARCTIGVNGFVEEIPPACDRGAPACHQARFVRSQWEEEHGRLG